MSFIVLCTFVLVFYLILWFFDSFFKSCMHYPYYAFLEGTGFRIGLFNLTWTTTAFNRCIYRWSKKLARFLQKWFTCGYIVSIGLFLPFAIWTLLTIILEHFSDNIPINDLTEVKAVLPGVNIPIRDFWIYFIALSVSSIFHEFGHALAATHEDVQLHAIGIYIFTIIPIAFVKLNSDHLNALSITKRLKICCAGIWHNIVCALVALLIFFSAPIIFHVGYETEVGVRVTSFTSDSPLRRTRGLEINDVIIDLNGCKIKNMKDWSYCIHKAHERYGICTSAEFVAQNDALLKEFVKENDVVECCRPDDLHHLCFEYMEPKVMGESVLPGQYSCLKPREMVKNGFIKCTEDNDFVCPKRLHCMKPSLNNSTYLMMLERKDKNPVLYLGWPYDLQKTLLVDQYFPRYIVFTIFSPYQFQKLLHYIIVFSMGIAFLNVIPCYGTDGHHIAHNLIQALAKYLNKNGDFVTFFTVFTVVVGTCITGPVLVYLFYNTIFTHGLMVDE